jgi:hypothetical protein
MAPLDFVFITLKKGWDAPKACIFSGNETTAHSHDSQETNLANIRAFACVIQLKMFEKHITNEEGKDKPDMLSKQKGQYKTRKGANKRILGSLHNLESCRIVRVGIIRD